jgi:hypothetical protein
LSDSTQNIRKIKTIKRTSPPKPYQQSFLGQAPVVLAYNLSYSGGRDQEDYSSKPAWVNSSQDPISKKPITKRAGGVAQGVGPEFKREHHETKTKPGTLSFTLLAILITFINYPMHKNNRMNYFSPHTPSRLQEDDLNA